MWSFEVPNAPCGVERQFFTYTMTCYTAVPNAPCGVESPYHYLKPRPTVVFLMHRVELKVERKISKAQGSVGS